MLHLHPRLILICKAWYNSFNELGLSDTIHQFEMNDNISARYLNRIGVHTCCKTDGKLSCRSSPDRIQMSQLSPIVIARLTKLTVDLPPTVALGPESSVSKRTRKRDCYSIAVDSKSAVTRATKRMRQCLPKHDVVYVPSHEPLKGKMYLFPYDLPLTTEGRGKFARIRPGKLKDLLRKLGSKCPIETYNAMLDTFSDETIYLMCRSIGRDGLSLVKDKHRAGSVEADACSYPDRRDGPTIAVWAPIRDAGDEHEYTIDEIDSMINVEELIQMLDHTYGTHVAKRKSVDCVGSNQYSDKSCVVSEQLLYLSFVDNTSVLTHWKRPKMSDRDSVRQTFLTPKVTARTSTPFSSR